MGDLVLRQPVVAVIGRYVRWRAWRVYPSLVVKGLKTDKKIHTYTHIWPTMENRPLVIIFMKIVFLVWIDADRVFGMNRCRFYCRVQRSKSQALNNFLSWVMAKNMYTGHWCLSLCFERRSILYMYIAQHSMFPYNMLRITPRSLHHNEFSRKDGHRERASTIVLVSYEKLDLAVELCWSA